MSSRQVTNTVRLEGNGDSERKGNRQYDRVIARGLHGDGRSRSAVDKERRSEELNGTIASDALGRLSGSRVGEEVEDRGHGCCYWQVRNICKRLGFERVISGVRCRPFLSNGFWSRTLIPATFSSIENHKTVKSFFDLARPSQDQNFSVVPVAIAARHWSSV